MMTTTDAKHYANQVAAVLAATTTARDLDDLAIDAMQTPADDLLITSLTAFADRLGYPVRFDVQPGNTAWPEGIYGATLHGKCACGHCHENMATQGIWVRDELPTPMKLRVLAHEIVHAMRGAQAGTAAEKIASRLLDASGKRPGDFPTADAREAFIQPFIDTARQLAETMEEILVETSAAIFGLALGLNIDWSVSYLRGKDAQPFMLAMVAEKAASLASRLLDAVMVAPAVAREGALRAA